MSDKVAIIIPAYNEGVQLKNTLNGLFNLPYAGRLLVVVVDDCSIEPVAPLVKGLPVALIRHSQNLGQGAALCTGMDYALLKGASYFIHFDADGQHNADDIAAFLHIVELGKADIVLGSRFLRAEDKLKVPFKKRVVLSLAIWFNFLLTGIKLSDAHNGFRVMNRKAAAALRIRNNRMAHATEILQLIKMQNLRYMEHPCTINYTDYSNSKGQTVWNSINIIVDTLIRTILK